jgi:deoxyadenosine/deoxycytidine kinase
MIVSLDGNIGSGKSSVLHLLRAEPDVCVFPEPVDEWTLLPKFYEDRARYALPFSLQVLESFVDAPTRVDATARGSVLVTERSPLTGREVFGKMLFNDGVLTDAQWDVYNAYYKKLGWTPHGIVYIDTPPAACLERVARRGREAEQTGVDLEYLVRLDRAHRVLLDHAGVPVEIVDGTLPPAEVASAVVRALGTMARYAAAATVT